ncbi:hypothetical protein L6164_013692 [Bauhinia variegata]|uniref:Uncharacterized protein n=1 Tax=Bauhinia variegata TaxID=167791 RepID=A0ACB9NF48_BAUVA|nr:hypothetical protein L6164_013692 [Bauhinia variegata]
MVIRIVECARSYANRRDFIVDLHGTHIDVTVTANAYVVKKWITSTLYLRRQELHHLVVGLGVQWTPGWRETPADTLQLCVGRRCLIFQLAYADYVPNVLRRFLSDNRFTFVGFYNHSDRLKLMISKHRLEMARDPLDLRFYAESEDEESLKFASVEEIVKECLGFDGVRLRREISMSNWDVEFLSDDQVLQACLDAHCAFEIGKNIGAWRIST